ncbi:MAG TPA: hypothetical protein VFN55_13480 [Solirubrobacteraceae bacterium]|nr:hypothetical protein [Solirubrobacteraceae bacterium]
MLTGPPRSRRARPVADAPIDALLARTEDLTKGWLLALLERAPLDDAPRILAADLTQDGPRLCAALLRAIADETDHRRLEPGGALEPLVARVGELAGAAGAAATSLAVDALHGVMWSALRAELREPDPDLISELAERLAQVTGLMRAAALDHQPAASAAAPTAPSPVREREFPVVRPVAPAPDPAPAAEPDAPAWRQPAEPEPEPPRSPPAWRQPAEPEPSPLWVGALQDEIHASGAAPLSLLLAELEDVDRVLAVETGSGAESAFGAFARAVRDVARRQDILVCESNARAWIIARDTGRSGAQALGMRIAAAVRAREPWRGAPLSASVGVAVLGEDGTSADELIEAAEEARFAAAAEGVDVRRLGPRERDPEPETSE